MFTSGYIEDIHSQANPWYVSGEYFPLCARSHVSMCACVCVFVCADSSSYLFVFPDMHATHLFPALYLLGQNTEFFLVMD